MGRMPKKTQLYRHYDVDGNLLYVGISLSSVHRLSQHRQQSHWFEQIRRVDVQHFASRTEALEAEAIAISEESPRYNVAAPRVRPICPIPYLFCFEADRVGAAIWIEADGAVGANVNGQHYDADAISALLMRMHEWATSAELPDELPASWPNPCFRYCHTH